MKIVIVTKTNSFILNSIEYQKGALSVNHGFPNGISIGNQYADLADIECDGETFNTIGDLRNWVHENLFRSGGGSGTGAVNSVTGDIVMGTPTDPVINYPWGFVNDSIEDWSYRRVPFFKTCSYIGTGLEDNTITLMCLPANISDDPDVDLAVIPASVLASNHPFTTEPQYDYETGFVTFKVSSVSEGDIFKYTCFVKKPL